jgi:phosphoglycerate kinase
VTQAAGLLRGLPLLEDLPALDGARVLLRVDFNVPLGDTPEGGRIVQDDFRIRAALPTIEWLTGHGAAVTACTHLGRPKGADPRYDVAPLREVLAKLAPGVSLLENLRFDPGEKSDDAAFVARLVQDADCYVNDAFGASHREHASIVGPPATLPSAAGRLLQREVEMLGRLLAEPARPFVAIVGGAKVADKIGVLRALLERVDRLVVGGAMAYTFMAARGRGVGASLVDLDQVEECASLLTMSGDRIVLPSDVVVLGPEGTIGPEGTGEVQVVEEDLPDGWQGVDAGPESVRSFAAAVDGAATVFWNGPVGAFEDPRFAGGTHEVARAVAACRGFTVVGGGDSVAALDRFGLAGSVDYVSTGGGAALELLEHGDLPGLAALRRAPNATRQGSER